MLPQLFVLCCAGVTLYAYFLEPGEPLLTFAFVLSQACYFTACIVFSFGKKLGEGFMLGAQAMFAAGAGLTLTMMAILLDQHKNESLAYFSIFFAGAATMVAALNGYLSLKFFCREEGDDEVKWVFGSVGENEVFMPLTA